MSGWLSGPRDSRPLGHSAIDGGGDPFSGARVVSVAHFEPAAVRAENARYTRAR